MSTLAERRVDRARKGGDLLTAEEEVCRGLKIVIRGSLEEGRLYRRRAGIRVLRMRPAEALEDVGRAERAARLQGWPASLVAPIRATEGAALADLGAFRGAVEATVESLSLYRGTGDSRRVALSLLNFVSILVTAGEVSRARALFIRLEREIPRRVGRGAALSWWWQRGRTALASGAPEAALEVWRPLQRDLDETRHVGFAADAYLDVAEAQAQRGDYLGLEASSARIVALCRSIGAPTGVLAAARLLADAARGRSVGSLAPLVHATRHARRAGAAVVSRLR